MKREYKTTIIIIIITLMYFGFNLSKGPTLIIKTPEPAEDFLVLCEWYSESFFKGGHGSGTYRSDYKVIVTESDKKVSCGWSLSGGSRYAHIYHPIYLKSFACNYDLCKSDRIENDVVIVEIKKTKLDKLDEQKAKFESGFWDKHKWPGAEYANSLKPWCGFGYQYFDYYKKVKRVDYDRFKNMYYSSVLSCYEKLLPELKKYDKSYKDAPSAEKYIEESWKIDRWENYNEK